MTTARADGSISGARASVPGRDRIERDDGEQAEVAHERQHEQRREQAHADQADPGELDAEAARAAATGAEAERQRQGGDEEQQREQPRLRRTSRAPGTRRQPT